MANIFTGTVTRFGGSWHIEPVPENDIQDEVAEKLKELTLSALSAGDGSFVWLSWPYCKAEQGDTIKSILEDFNDTLKQLPQLRRRTRWSKTPTKLIHDEKAKMAVLYIEG